MLPLSDASERGRRGCTCPLLLHLVARLPLLLLLLSPGGLLLAVRWLPAAVRLLLAADGEVAAALSGCQLRLLLQPRLSALLQLARRSSVPLCLLKLKLRILRCSGPERLSGRCCGSLPHPAYCCHPRGAGAQNARR